MSLSFDFGESDDDTLPMPGLKPSAGEDQLDDTQA